MADLSLTAANVVGSTGYGSEPGTYGEAVTAGQVCYLKAADGKFWVADCTTSAATATVRGIAMQSAAASQPGRLQTSGGITIGAVVTVGTIYVLSASGLICPAADLATADWVSIIGVGTTASVITLGINNSGVQVPA